MMMNNLYNNNPNMMMGYNNYNQLQPAQQPLKQITNMEWVNGDIGASAYLVQGYNSAVALFDSESDDKMYIKTTDNTGRPFLRKFRFIEEFDNEPSKELDLSAYVKKDELQALLLELIPQKEGVPNEQNLPAVQQPIIRKTVTATK